MRIEERLPRSNEQASRANFYFHRRPKKRANETADQTTLFLDEVGDVPVDIQPKLLRHVKRVNLNGWEAFTHEE